LREPDACEAGDGVSARLAARRPVLLSTDCGCEMDGQWALALLALSPAFDLRADDMTFEHAGQGTGEIQWITAPEECRLWEQFVEAVQAAGHGR
jgi:hypothetical protein